MTLLQSYTSPSLTKIDSDDDKVEADQRSTMSKRDNPAKLLFINPLEQLNRLHLISHLMISPLARRTPLNLPLPNQLTWVC